MLLLSKVAVARFSDGALVPSSSANGKIGQWLPPDELPVGGAYVHVVECPLRLLNESIDVDLQNLCGEPFWKLSGYRATSYVRPMSSGLFFTPSEGLVILQLSEASTVGGWPHDAWGTNTAREFCPSYETPQIYARRRLEHFVKYCADHAEANRLWATSEKNKCWYKTRQEIEERQYAYLDLFQENGTSCSPGQLHNQIMVKWEPKKITRIFYTKQTLAAAVRIRDALPKSPRVELSSILKRCDTCCEAPVCPNPLLSREERDVQRQRREKATRRP